MKTRTEKDSLGSYNLPDDVYYGVYTARVVDNFPITGRRVSELFLRVYIRVKKTYAWVNREVEKLDPEIAEGIIHACDEILSREDADFYKHFPIDIIQSGGGTSTNMMINEVLANLANDLLGMPKGAYKPVHPNDHVNMSQSSNDTFPGVVKIMSLLQIEKLITELEKTEHTFRLKILEFEGIEKTGRTHLQDALRMQLSEEFSAFYRTLEKNREYLKHIKIKLRELPLGATALGSMQNITPKIRREIIRKISAEFSSDFVRPINYFEGTSSSSDFVKISAALSSLAGDCIKIANDLRLLSSGPRAGLQEIQLPSVQAGSSIMPGKVNPSILEALNMLCFKVIGNHHAIELANLHAQLQLQAFMPIIGFTLCENFELLTNGMTMFREKCLKGILSKPEEIARHLNRSFVFATEYSEKLGYAKVAELVKKSYEENLHLRDLLEAELKNR